jgi:hypothetical protein
MRLTVSLNFEKKRRHPLPRCSLPSAADAMIARRLAFDRGQEAKRRVGWARRAELEAEADS